MKHTFRGTTAECFAHLVKDTADGHFRKREILASFVGVQEQAVQRWFSGSMWPAGESFLRLQFYLEFLGYNVIELESLSQTVRDTARLLAFSVATRREIVQLVGYPESKSGDDSLLKVFLGTKGVTKERLNEFESFVKAFGDKLEAKKQTTPKIQLNAGVGKVEAINSKLGASRDAIHLLPKTRVPLPKNCDVIIESLVASVKALVPLARAVSSDAFTASQRKQVRKLAGEREIFDLANLLYRLCGERSRKIHMDEQQAMRNEQGDSK